jgi:threonine aldolase
MPIDTNILIFSADDVDDILNKLEAKGVLGIPFSTKDIRLVTHLDFTDDMLAETIGVLKSL